VPQPRITRLAAAKRANQSCAIDKDKVYQRPECRCNGKVVKKGMDTLGKTRRTIGVSIGYFVAMNVLGFQVQFPRK